jgi:hypothetical protein
MLTYVAAGDTSVFSPPDPRADIGRTAKIIGKTQFDDLDGRNLLRAGFAQ